MYGFGLFYTIDGKEKNANFCTEIYGLFWELNGSSRTFLEHFDKCRRKAPVSRTKLYRRFVCSLKRLLLVK